MQSFKSGKFTSLQECSNGEIAQLVEQAAHIRSVRGPSPFLARVPVRTGIFFFNDRGPSSDSPLFFLVSSSDSIFKNSQPLDLYFHCVAFLHP